MNTPPFTSKLIRTQTDVLAIHCGDYRFQSAFHEFLSSALNLPSYDLMVIPGGPLTLAPVEPFPQYHWATWNWTRFFVEIHQLRRLILIQHQDCGFYKSMSAHLHVPPDFLRLRQEDDLRRIRESLARELSQLAVDTHYASWDSSDRILIEPVS